MRKVQIEELFLMNGRAARILSLLRDKTEDGAKFVSFTEIGRELGMSRHSVYYNVGVLLRGEYLRIEDGKISLAVELPSEFRFPRTGKDTGTG